MAGSRLAVVFFPLVASLVGIVCGADDDWWKTSLIYQVYPRSYMDSDGDGVGDLKGITSGLDHLAEMGVTLVWLSPIYPSPQIDFGYDISNHTDIDPQYGTLADFDGLQKRCKELGLKLVVDLVPNHVSDQHEWFKKSVKREGKYTNYFIWHDGKRDSDGTRYPPNNWLSVFRGTGWTWNEERGQYYYHQFAPEQPELDLRNEDVLKDIDAIFEFWSERGVDGFRIDAAPFLFESPNFEDEPRAEGPGVPTDPQEYYYLNHTFTIDQPENFLILKRWRKLVDKTNRVMMAEAYTTPENLLKYYGEPDAPGAHFSFNFFFLPLTSLASKAWEFNNVISFFMAMMGDFYVPNWVIGNHDQTRVATRYGPEMVDSMNMLSLTLPGISVTYYGEEIGMDNSYVSWEETVDLQGCNEGPQNFVKRSRDPLRTPFQWNAQTPAAGFSTSNRTWLPVNPNYSWLNLEAQKKAVKSHYKIYKTMVRARKEPAMQKGKLNSVTCCAGNSSIDPLLVLTRSLEGYPTFVLVINVGSRDLSVPMNKINNSPSEWYVWTSSSNCDLTPGTKVGSNLFLRTKAAVLITTGSVPSSAGQFAATTSVVVLMLSFIFHQL